MVKSCALGILKVMVNGIERKFLVKNLPNLSGIIPVLYDKHFIQGGDVIEEAVQKRGGIFEYEKKVCLSRHECSIQRSAINEKEFDRLKTYALHVLSYESYTYDSYYETRIIIFKGLHAGLIRADVYFTTQEEADDYEIELWMGREVTSSPLGIDKLLVSLDHEQCAKILHQEIVAGQS